MPNYTYKAKNLYGMTLSGTQRAGNESELMAQLHEKKLFLLEAREVKVKENLIKLKPLEISEFSRQIGNMLSAGVPLIHAVSIVRNRDNPPRLQKAYNRIHRSLQEGLLLSEAVKELGGTFPVLYTAMLTAGEANGHLGKTLLTLADHYQREHRLNNRISSATVYPRILFVVIILVVLAIFLFILPNFFSVFKGMTLPFPTRVMLAISNGLIDGWYYFLAGGLLIFGIGSTLLQRESVRRKLDEFKLHIPVVHKLLVTIYTARFARTISSLYSSGIPIIQALYIGRKTIGNRYIDAQFDKAIQMVQSGISFSEAIKSIEGFDSKLTSSIVVGEETSRLDEMLVSVADTFDYEAESATQRLVTLIEPIMVILMALIVGFIMISVMLPILQMYQNVQNY